MNILPTLLLTALIGLLSIAAVVVLVIVIVRLVRRSSRRQEKAAEQQELNRRKIDDPYERKLIHTVRGMGYVLKEE